MASKALTKEDIFAQAGPRNQARSQATIVEQSRAIAEVQGALIVAERRPRDRQAALDEALQSCRTQDVAQAAFFKFPRGGQTVAGATIHLARELARCWGNIVYAIVELDRDDNRHVSEMMAYAWDLETNARSQTQFLVPHKRDKKGGAEVLTDMRDIYENNANMGARRLRECIFAVLPPYLTKAAERQCHATLQGGEDEKPLPVRINEAIAAFEKLGIGRDRIEAKMGLIGRFTPVDYANLRVSYGSIQRNEVSADDEFPRVDRLTGDQMAQSAKTPAKSLAEELGDEIPDFRENKPEDAPREPSPLPDPSKPEGAPLDEPEEDEDPAAKFLSDIRAQVAAAKTVPALKKADDRWLTNRVAYSDETQAEIDGLIAARRRELQGGEGGK